jgi:glutaredoxin
VSRVPSGSIRLRRRLLALGAALVLGGSVGPGCSRRETDDGTTPQPVAELPPLALGDDTPNLLLTWLDDKGGGHTEVNIADVPADARKLVRVVVSDRKDGQGARFYVADLSEKHGDGSYAVRTMSRSEWEAELERRRAAYFAQHAPPPVLPPSGGAAGAASGSPAGPSAAGLTAIIYGAPWCGPCHMAKAYLEKRHVPVVEKNIDDDRAAVVEMQRKLAAVGKAGASIPVIDIGGVILVGFSAQAVDQAIARARGGTAL